MKPILHLAFAALLLLGAIDTPQPYDHPREKIEWTNIMHYSGDDTAVPRVLLIGDSICNQYNDFVREELAGAANVSFYATSKCCTDRAEHWSDDYHFKEPARRLQAKQVAATIRQALM